MKAQTRRDALVTLCSNLSPFALSPLGMVPSMAQAQEAIPLLKIWFGYPPGGAGDLVTRGLGMNMTDYAKASIVESKPGAAGRLVMDSVKSAPADGSSVIVTPSSVVSMYPHVYSKLN